jgi:hypothetical protein
VFQSIYIWFGCIIGYILGLRLLEQYFHWRTMLCCPGGMHTVKFWLQRWLWCIMSGIKTFRLTHRSSDLWEKVAEDTASKNKHNMRALVTEFTRFKTLLRLLNSSNQHTYKSPAIFAHRFKRFNSNSIPTLISLFGYVQWLKIYADSSKSHAACPIYRSCSRCSAGNCRNSRNPISTTLTLSILKSVEVRVPAGSPLID